MVIREGFLEATGYFNGLDAAALAAVQKVVFEKTVGRGEILVFEGGPAEISYFVVAGAVKVYKTSSDGKEQILELVRPGESFNDVPVFKQGVNLSSAEALGSVVLYGIKKSDLELICRDYPRVLLNVNQVLSVKVEHLISLVEDLSFKNVTGRVAKILLEQVEDGGSPGHRLTQQEMAALAGTAREMVGRSLKALEEDKAIRLDHHRIVITNKETLREIAGMIT